MTSLLRTNLLRSLPLRHLPASCAVLASQCVRHPPPSSAARRRRHGTSSKANKPPTTSSSSASAWSAELRASVIRRRPSPSRRPTSAVTKQPSYTLPHAGLTARQLAALCVGASTPSAKFRDVLESILRRARSVDGTVSDTEHVLPSAVIDLVCEELSLPVELRGELIEPLFSAADGEETKDKEEHRTQSEQQQQEGRIPVVTVMGHVDHGKTSLLDALRNTQVAAGEDGGITQSIGAFQLTVDGGGTITFIDTPGHEAFSSMRRHGAVVTDIIVLMVAVNDGVKPQTAECIRLAADAGIPLIVALNKVDLVGDDLPRLQSAVHAQLLRDFDIHVEQTGGSVQCVPLSARTGVGIPALLDAIVLQAGECGAAATTAGTPARPRLVCIESHVDKFLGASLTAIVRHGRVRKGDFIVMQNVTGVSQQQGFGRVKMMLAPHSNADLPSGGPGQAVRIIGVSDAVSPGSDLWVADSEREARAKARAIQVRAAAARDTLQAANHSLAERLNKAQRGHTDGSILSATASASASNTAAGDAAHVVFDARLEGGLRIVGDGDGDECDVVPIDQEPVKEENDSESTGTKTPTLLSPERKTVQVVVKGDVRGSADAVADAIRKLSDDEVHVRVVHVGVGDATDSDMALLNVTQLTQRKTKSKRKSKKAQQSEEGEKEKAVLVAFNVRVRAALRKAAATAGVTIVADPIIYKLQEDVENIVAGMRVVEAETRVVGAARVLRVFEDGAIAGCTVEDGELSTGASARVLRPVVQDRDSDGEDGLPENEAKDVVFEGEVVSIKQFAKDVRSIKKGFECGIRLAGWEDFRGGDEIHAIEKQ